VTWTPEGRIPIIYRPEDVEQMEIELELLKTLQDRPERFLLLFQPRFSHWSWFNALFEKILKLVKREAIKEIARVEGDLHYAKEQLQQSAKEGTP
jgi:hypothetical protein